MPNFTVTLYVRPPGPNRHDLYRNGEEVFYCGEFFPNLMVKEASGFIENNKNNPFFLYFSLNTPHYPYQGTPEWIEYYQEQGVAYPRDLYAAFISTQDEKIGELLQKLEDLGLRENTIIIFQSDNGHSTEERAHFGGGSAGITTRPAVIPIPGKIISKILFTESFNSRSILKINQTGITAIWPLCRTISTWTPYTSDRISALMVSLVSCVTIWPLFNSSR